MAEDAQFDDALARELGGRLGMSEEDITKLIGTANAQLRGGDEGGKRALDDAAKVAALSSMPPGIPRELRENVLEGAREALVCGAERCSRAECTKAGTNRCSKCRSVRYCGRECQLADWRAGHKRECGRLANGLSQTSASVSAARLVENLQAGTTGGWYGGLSRERVHERCVFSFALRVEDEYTMGGYVGIMAAVVDEVPQPRPGDMNNPVLDEFKQYLERAKQKGVLPQDWSEDDQRKVLELAASRGGIYNSWTKSDIVEKFGYASGEHFVLRSLAESILGPIGNWV